MELIDYLEETEILQEFTRDAITESVEYIQCLGNGKVDEYEVALDQIIVD